MVDRRGRILVATGGFNNIERCSYYSRLSQRWLYSVKLYNDQVLIAFNSNTNSIGLTPKYRNIDWFRLACFAGQCSVFRLGRMLVETCGLNK